MKIDLPDDWKETFAELEDSNSKLNVGKLFGVSVSVIQRWIDTDNEFRRAMMPPRMMPMDHRVSLTNRIDDLIACHDGFEVKSLLVMVPDLVIVLKEVREQLAKQRGENRMLASALNRRIHAEQVRKSGERPAHSSGEKRADTLSVVEPVPDA